MQVIVVGLGRFGSRVALDLALRGAEVIAVDVDEKVVDGVKDRLALALCLDGTDERALRQAGAVDVDVGVVAVGQNIEQAILCTAVLRRLGVPHIVSRATTPLQAEILREVGAKRVVQLEEHMGRQVAQEIMEPGVGERLRLSSGHHPAELKVRRRLVGRSLADLALRRQYRINVISIQRRTPILDEEGRPSFHVEINDVPGPDDVLGEHDTLVVIGAETAIADLAAEGERKAT